MLASFNRWIMGLNSMKIERIIPDRQNIEQLGPTIKHHMVVTWLGKKNHQIQTD